MIYGWHLDCMANVQASTGGTLRGIPADPFADALESFVAKLVPLYTSSSQVLGYSLVGLTRVKMGIRSSSSLSWGLLYIGVIEG